MEERAQLQFLRNDESVSNPNDHALWQSVRRPRRGRVSSPSSEQPGPYESSYTIQNGYPDREILLP